MFSNEDGLSVSIKKEDLVKALTSNKEEHIHTFKQAREAFQAAMVKELERRLEDAMAGRAVDHIIHLSKPTHHEKDYDRVLKMLEMTDQDSITLTEKQFNQYVLDRWDWKGQWVGTTSCYVDVPGLVGDEDEAEDEF
jgi:hypothetical protein